MDIRIGSKVSNFLIMMPSFAVFAYVIPYIVPNMNPYVWIPLFTLPFIKLFMPKALRQYLYRTVLVLILLLFLYAEFSYAGLLGGFGNPYLLSVLLTFPNILSFEMSLAFIMLVEGTLTSRERGAVSYMLISFLVLAEQLSAVYLYNSGEFRVLYSQLLPYLSSLPLVPGSGFQFAYEISFLMQYYAIYTLIFLGAEGIQLPLNALAEPYNFVILVSFVISFVAIASSFYLGGNRDRRYRLSGIAVSMTTGVAIAIVFLFVMRVMQNYDYQFLALSILLALLWLYAAHVIRKSSKTSITNI